MPIPWAAILRHAPTVVAAAQSLLATQSKRANDRQQSIETRLDQLEKASLESAQLVQDIAQQMQALTLAEQELQKRLQVALIAGAVGIVFGIAAIALIFLR